MKKVFIVILFVLFNSNLEAMHQELYDQLAKRYYDSRDGDHVDKDHIIRIKNELYDILIKVDNGIIEQSPDSLKAELSENDCLYINALALNICNYFLFCRLPEEIIQLVNSENIIDLNKLIIIYHYFNTIVKKYYIEVKCELENHLKRVYIEFKDIDDLYTFIAEFKSIPGTIIFETTKQNNNHYYAIFEMNPIFSNEEISNLIKKQITVKYKKVIMS